MSRLEILQRCGAAEVERILANAAVARSVALAAGDVGKAMLDGNTLT